MILPAGGRKEKHTVSYKHLRHISAIRSPALFMCGKHREALFHGVFKVGQLHLHLLVCVKGEELEWSKNVVSL